MYAETTINIPRLSEELKDNQVAEYTLDLSEFPSFAGDKVLSFRHEVERAKENNMHLDFLKFLMYKGFKLIHYQVPNNPYDLAAMSVEYRAFSYGLDCVYEKDFA